MRQEALLNTLKNYLFAPQQSESEKDAGRILYTYALLDTASDESFYALLLKFGPEKRSLFTGNLADDLEDCAPYIIRLKQDSKFTQVLLNATWGKGCISFCQSHYDIESLAKHFQRYVRVALPEDNAAEVDIINFAFYDPRILKDFLALQNLEQVQDFSAGIVSYYYEDDFAADHDILIQTYPTAQDNDIDLPQVIKRIPLTEPYSEKSSVVNKTDINRQSDASLPSLPSHSILLTQFQLEVLQAGQVAKFCFKELKKMNRLHSAITTGHLDTAIQYQIAAVTLGLDSEATQSRYMLLSILVGASAVTASPALQDALAIAKDEYLKMQILDQAIEQYLDMKKQNSHDRSDNETSIRGTTNV